MRGLFSNNILVYSFRRLLLPRIEDMILKLAKYRVFSTFDLKSAYHQLELRESDKPFTAF